jgi:hypothetical protein
MNVPHPSRLPARLARHAPIVLALLLAGAAHAETKSPAAASSFMHGCSGELKNTSVSITDDDGRQRWTIKLEGTRCRIDFRMEGRATFNDDFTDLVSLPPGGSFRLDVTDDGERRQLDITPGVNGLERSWKVNGREQPYDAAARAWLGEFLVEMDRRTAIAVDQRLPILLRKGGVSGVLAETAHLSSADQVRVLDQASALGSSDYYDAELLKGLGLRARDDAQVRAAMVRMIQSMSSDYYQAESVKQALGTGPLDTREVDFLIDVIQKMKSDYYKTEVLKQIPDKIDASQRKKLAAVARDIKEDSYACEFVKALAASSDRSEVRTLIDAAATIDSEYYLSESVNAILANSSLTDADLLAIVKTVAPTKSEYYRAEMLRHVLAHRAVTEPVRRAALDATGGMSSYYREEVEKASGGR